MIVTINGGTPVEVVCEDGTWTYTPETPLPDGPATVEVVQEDEAGNVSDPTEVEFVVDATAPEAPVITAPAPGHVVGDSTPTIVRTGEPGATVEVTIAPGPGDGDGGPGDDGDGGLRIWIREPVVEQGQEQHGIGYGFEPGETVTVTVYSTPHVLGTFTADANGELHATWVIPADEEIGEHRLEMVGAASGGIDITFRVVEASGAGVSGLATTGGDAAPAAMLGLLVLMLGAGLLVTGRRARLSAAE